MHAKHRYGRGNGYRGNSVGMSSIGFSSRSSFEGPGRGRRMYNSEYRNNSRGGYGRGGHLKHFQQQMPPTREVDVLIEAGRMAAEFLFSKELLTPAALSEKYGDASGNQLGDFEIRSQKVDVLNRRVSVHARLGNDASSVRQGRRRYSGDYISEGSTSSMKGGKRADSLKRNGRDFRLPYVAGDANAFDSHEQSPVEDVHSGVRTSSFVEANREVENDSHFRPGFGKGKEPAFAEAKDSSWSDEVAEQSNAEGLLTKKCHDIEKVDDNETREVKDGNDLLQKCLENEKIKDLQQRDDENEKDAVSDHHSDLQLQCKFANMPKKLRSSLTGKGSRNNRQSTSEDKKYSSKECFEGSSVQVMNIDTVSSVRDDYAYQKPEYQSLQLNVAESPPLVTNASLDSSRSGSKRIEMDDNLSSFATSNATLLGNRKKRSLDYGVGDNEQVNKFGQCAIPMDDQPMVQMPGTSQHALSSGDDKGLDISLSSDSSFQVMKEKDLFPASFKTCDLNLNGSHESDSVLPSSKQIGNTSMPIDIDLSMSNTSELPITNSKHVSENDIEVIDLEKDSAMDVQTFGNSERRGEALFSSFDSFPNNLHSADNQDGFGIMISDYLGNHSPNSVPTDLNSLHNQMVLSNHEGILADDDSIYMSFGEIPISFLGSWEQPNQDFEKPF